MGYFPKGKHVTIDINSPQALGICDYSRFVHKRNDLVKQYEWRGDALIWTGFYVGRSYLDEPNQQLRPPILPPDPIPIIDPRPMQPTVITWANNYNLPWQELGEVPGLSAGETAAGPITWTSWSGCDNAIPAAFPAARLTALEAGVPASNPPLSPGALVPQHLTQQQVLQQLQQYKWSA